MASTECIFAADEVLKAVVRETGRRGRGSYKVVVYLRVERGGVVVEQRGCCHCGCTSLGLVSLRLMHQGPLPGIAAVMRPMDPSGRYPRRGEGRKTGSPATGDWRKSTQPLDMFFLFFATLLS